MTSEWEDSTLGDVLTLQRGLDLPVQDRKGGKHPIVASTGVVGFHNEAPVKAPGVVIGRSGSIGGGQFIDQDFWPLNTTLWVKNFKGNDPRYCYYLLKSIDFSPMNAGSGVPTLNRNHLHPLRVGKPPVSVQKSISGILGSLDDRITLLRETNQTLEAIAQALFKSWFVDFDAVRAKAEGRLPDGVDAASAELFPESFDETELELVPKGWRVARIGDITAVIDCLHSKKPELIESEFPFLQLSNIRDDGLLDILEVKGVSENDYKKWTSRIEVAGSDCVITNVGRVGAVAQIPEGFKAAMGRNMTAIRLSSKWPYPTYLIELLQSPWMQAEITAKTDVGTILNALNVKSIPQLRCVVADSSVMSAFEGIARPLRNAMEKNLCTTHTLSNLRDTLLPRLISGELRIADAETELEKAIA